MGWKDWIFLISGALVFALAGGLLVYNIHKLKSECKEDMRKKLHGDDKELKEELLKRRSGGKKQG